MRRRRPTKGYAELAEQELAVRQIERWERRAEAALQRRKEERQVALGVASIDAVRRVVGRTGFRWDR